MGWKSPCDILAPRLKKQSPYLQKFFFLPCPQNDVTNYHSYRLLLSNVSAIDLNVTTLWDSAKIPFRQYLHDSFNDVSPSPCSKIH